jgi:hypothetical protein
MTRLQEQWDELIADEADDWSHLAAEIRIDDSERSEEAGLLLCSANPWHGTTWRTGLFRFRVARTQGYGASAQLVRSLLGRLDNAAIGGRLEFLRVISGAAQVGSQGPLL